ncbi:hypothetical protein ACGFZQ_51620 [Streptomyces sp. NPDC048254]|uniref:hypothetical protein n=1 Tax=Streptomyces sp. NPDC048254 TaxID=3365525 RepID=UPI003718BF57
MDCCETDAVYDAFWCLAPRPDGQPAPKGPIAGTTADKLELVAGGQALALAPASVENVLLRRDLTAVPVEGIEPCRVVLATRAKDRGPRVNDFPGVAVNSMRR